MTESVSFVSDLVDLTQMPLAKLRALDQSILGEALRRVAKEAEDSLEVVAGFQAAI
jgi:FXSXX-COOH protein